MALGNYGQLKTAIADLINRGDLTTVIPDFITMLEETVNRETKLRNRRMETTATLTFTGDTAPLPNDFLEVRTAVYLSSPRVRLEYMSPSQFETTYTTDSGGQSINFTIEGNNFRAGPTPDITAGVRLNYYQRVPALTADGDTNWVLTYHPSIYLYGSAMHSAPYLGEDPRLQTWIGLYDRAVAEISNDDTRARFSGSPLRSTLSVDVV